MGLHLLCTRVAAPCLNSVLSAVRLASNFQRTDAAAERRCFPQPASASGKRLLIVGGSIAGHTAAQTARALDPTVHITLVTDERYTFYNRLNLTRFLAEEVGA